MTKDYRKALQELYSRFISKGKPLDSFALAELDDNGYDYEEVMSDLRDMENDDAAVEEEDIVAPVKKQISKPRSVTELRSPSVSQKAESPAVSAKQKTYSFKLDVDMMDEFREKAWERRVSMAQLLREAIQSIP